MIINQHILVCGDSRINDRNKSREKSRTDFSKFCGSAASRMLKFKDISLEYEVCYTLEQAFTIIQLFNDRRKNEEKATYQWDDSLEAYKLYRVN